MVFSNIPRSKLVAVDLFIGRKISLKVLCGLWRLTFFLPCCDFQTKILFPSSYTPFVKNDFMTIKFVMSVK